MWRMAFGAGEQVLGLHTLNAVVIVPTFHRIMNPVHGIPGIIRVGIDIILEMTLQTKAGKNVDILGNSGG